LENQRDGLFEIVEMTMLHTPNYDVRGRAFCGPTAMSAVTGLPISEIREMIRDVWGKTKSNGHAMPVMGLDNASLLASMRRFGWEVADTADCENGPDERRNRFRLGDFLDAKGDDGPFIVNVTGHYYAVSQGEICDTFSCLPKEIVRFRKGRARWVKRWWKFERT
jgi:hypothetical protein